MRIAFITTSFPMGDRRSSGIFVERLVRSIAKDHQVEVITPAATQPLGDPTETYRLTPFRYGPWRWQRLAHQPGGVPVALRQKRWLLLLVPAFLAAMFWSCWRASRECDVLHANWAPTGVVAGLAALLRRRPVVTTIRGEDTARLERSWFSRLLMRICLILSQRVVCVSNAMAATLASRFPRQARKISFIGNGVSPEFLAVPQSIDRADPVVFAIVGSLIPRKGVDTAVRALSLLAPAQRARIRCRLIGDGPEEGPLRALADELGVSASVEFAGSTSPENVPRALASSHALLICSHHEGRPNVVIEAMAAARPIVGTHLPGIRELVRHEQEGLIFAPGDAQALAVALDRLAKNGALRTRFGANARARIHELQLTWSGAAANYERVYAAAMQAPA